MKSPGDLEPAYLDSRPVGTEPSEVNYCVMHFECPDILEWEVKWALGSITMNKTSGGDGIPVELFQILKDDAVKVLDSICQQIWKTQQWPQDWKMFSFQSQRKAMPKNAQTTAQLHSSHTYWRRKWQPTPVFFPGESQGWGSLVGCLLWGRTEWDTTEVTQQQEQHTLVK